MHAPTRSRTLRRVLTAAVALCLSGAGALPGAVAAVLPGNGVVADAFEPADDVWGARDLTAFVPGFGASPYRESHTFRSSDPTAAADVDWVSVSVTSDDVGAGVRYLVDAVSSDEGVRPVVEIYGPGDPAPTAPEALPASAEESGTTATDPAAGWADQAGAWTGLTGASASFTPTVPGEYHVRVRPYYQGDFGGAPVGYSAEGSYELRIKTGFFSRVWGPDRIATAVAMSRERFADGSLEGGAVVVASGMAFPDALAGSTLAGVLGSPVLLTYPAVLLPALSDEIARLGADHVYLLGGRAAVSDGVASAIDALPGVSVERIAGPTRMQTAALAARAASAAAGPGGLARLAFVVNAYSFPDALSAAPLAVRGRAPVLLTGRDALEPEAAALLSDPGLGITDAVIVGSPAVVSTAVEGSLRQRLGAGHVRRVAGATRYETAKEFAVWATADGAGAGSVGTSDTPDALPALAYDRVGVASGEAFPDALGGAVLCGHAGAPLLITPCDQVTGWIFADLGLEGVPRGSDYYGAGEEPIRRSFVFGGPSALTDSVFVSLDLISGTRYY